MCFFHYEQEYRTYMNIEQRSESVDNSEIPINSESLERLRIKELLTQ